MRVACGVALQGLHGDGVFNNLSYTSWLTTLCTVSIGTAVRQLYLGLYPVASCVALCRVFFLFIICVALHSGGIFKNLLHASWPGTAVLVYSSVTAC